MSASAYAGPPPPDPSDFGHWISPERRPVVPIDWSAHGITLPTPTGDLLKRAIDDAVEKALRDPALLAAALVMLSQPIRDQVRVLLDALEAGSPREE